MAQLPRESGGCASVLQSLPAQRPHPPAHAPQVENGKGAMPAWAGRLSDEEIQVGPRVGAGRRDVYQPGVTAHLPSSPAATEAGLPLSLPPRPPPSHQAVAAFVFNQASGDLW